jgi:hypothetical protein
MQEQISMPEKGAVISIALAVQELALVSYQKTIAEARESMRQDTKSSAGDKYETGRAMVQQEIDKTHEMLRVTQDHISSLKMLAEHSHPMTKVQQGALLELSIGLFLIGPAIGKQQVGAYSVQYVSASAPLVKALWLREAGDSIHFLGKTIGIVSVA